MKKRTILLFVVGLLALGWSVLQYVGARYHAAYARAVNAGAFDDRSNSVLHHPLVAPFLPSVSRYELHRNEALMKRNSGKDLVGAAQALIAEAERCGEAPLCAELYFNAGEIFHRLDAIDEAEAAYQRALILNPGHRDAVFNYEALFRLVEMRHGVGEAGQKQRPAPRAGEESREGDQSGAGRGTGPEGGL